MACYLTLWDEDGFQIAKNSLKFYPGKANDKVAILDDFSCLLRNSCVFLEKAKHERLPLNLVSVKKDIQEFNLCNLVN